MFFGWLFILFISTMINISFSINNCQQSPVTPCKAKTSGLSELTCYVNYSTVSENMIPVDLECLEIEGDYNGIQKFDRFHLSLERITKIDRPIQILNEHLFNFSSMELIIISNEIHIDKCPFCYLQNNNKQLKFTVTNLKIYKNNQLIQKESDCNPQVFNQESIFNNFTDFEIRGIDKSSSKICPLLFKYVSFDSFTFINHESLNEISYVFVDTNQDPDARMSTVYLIGFKQFSRLYFNKYLFKHSYQIHVNLDADEKVSIDDDAFDDFMNLRKLSFDSLDYSNINIQTFYSEHKKFFLNLRQKTFNSSLYLSLIHTRRG